jgi:hypothetical protein
MGTWHKGKGTTNPKFQFLFGIFRLCHQKHRANSTFLLTPEIVVMDGEKEHRENRERGATC